MCTIRQIVNLRFKNFLKSSINSHGKFGSSTPIYTISFSSSANSNKQPQEKVSIWQKGGQLWKDYGYVALGSYAALYFVTLGSVFVCLDQDLLNVSQFGIDATTIVNSVSI